MNLLTLVRHGQASYMSTDYDRLSPIGERQAKLLGELWARNETRFDLVFTGPAKRHIRTMEIAAEVVKSAGVPFPEPSIVANVDEFDGFEMTKRMIPLLIETDERVRTRFALFQEKQNSPQAGVLLQELFEAVAYRWSAEDWDTPGLETWAAFRTRVHLSITDIRARLTDNQSALIVTSGGPIAATIAQTLELRPEKAIEFVWNSRNASFSEFVQEPDRFCLSSFNATPHLHEADLLTYR